MPIRIQAGDGVPILKQLDSSSGIEPGSVLFDLGHGKEPLALSWYKQMASNWCWAASAQMVLRFMGFTSVKQCDIANIMGNRRDCCQPLGPVPESGPIVYNHACDAADVTRVYKDGWNVDSVAQEGVLPFEMLEQEINEQRRPVEVGIQWAHGKGRHLVVIYGCQLNDANEQLLHVRDPLPDYCEGQVLYDELMNSYLGQGTWIYSWSAIAKSE